MPYSKSSGIDETPNFLLDNRGKKSVVLDILNPLHTVDLYIFKICKEALYIDGRKSINKVENLLEII